MLLNELSNNHTLDRRRVAMTGLSFGADLTHWSLFNGPPLAAAIVSGPGYDSLNYFLTSPSLRSSYRAWGFPLPIGEGRDRWDHLSASANASAIRTPLLVNAADSEFLLVVPTVVALQERQRAVEMYVYPNEGHVKSQPVHRAAIYRRNVAWLRFWLLGVDIEQYPSWRTMRGQQCDLFGPDGSERFETIDVPWYCPD